MSDLEVKNRVYQSNQLIESSYTLTLNEKRLILFAASLLDSEKPAPKDGLVTVSAEAFALAFGMEVRHAYGVLGEAIERLGSRWMKRYTYSASCEVEPEPDEMRWIYHKKYMAKEGRVLLGFSPTVLPHLTLLNREFTGIQLKNITNLTSFKSFRIYELTAQYLNFGKRYFDLERLRQLLQMEDKYPKVKDFRKYVLDLSVKDVNQSTDLALTLEPRRKGRTIVGFEFTIKRSEQIPLGI